MKSQLPLWFAVGVAFLASCGASTELDRFDDVGAEAAPAQTETRIWTAPGSFAYADAEATLVLSLDEHFHGRYALWLSHATNGGTRNVGVVRGMVLPDAEANEQASDGEPIAVRLLPDDGSDVLGCADLSLSTEESDAEEYPVLAGHFTKGQDESLAIGLSVSGCALPSLFWGYADLDRDPR